MHASARPSPSVFVLVVGLVALARAGVLAFEDGYFAAGLVGMGVDGVARDWLVALVVCAPAVFATWFLASRLPARHAPAVAALSVFAWAFVTGRLPLPPASLAGRPSWRLDLVAGVPAALLVALVLVAGRRASRAPRLTLLAARLTAVLALVAALRLATAGRPSADRGRPNVVLVSLDTVRADHLGCYGYGRPTTPRLDRFARRATRFTNAFASQPWTLTSHMSLLTGLYPPAHGVGTRTSLGGGVPTLAGAFQGAGYRTLALVDPVVWMSPRYGFDRGFHLYRRVHGGAPATNAQAFALLDVVGERPFFLFLHYFDAHSDHQRLPYDAHPNDRELLGDGVPEEYAACDERLGCATEKLQGLNRTGEPLSPAALRDLVVHYDSGLRTLDRELGVLIDELERRGHFEDSVIVITADHGEAFREHGRFLHEQAYDEALRVPLIVRLPGQTEERVSAQLVSQIDVPATLLAACGLPRELGQGRSFAGLLAGEAQLTPREELFLMDGHGTVGLRTATHKLLRKGEREELYDLVGDPGERVNLLATASVPAALRATLPRLRDRLERMLEENRSARAAHAPPDPAPVALTEPELEGLRALGYLGGEMPTNAPEDR